MFERFIEGITKWFLHGGYHQLAVILWAAEQGFLIYFILIWLGDKLGRQKHRSHYLLSGLCPLCKKRYEQEEEKDGKAK